MPRYIDADKLYSRVKRETNPYGKPTLDYESGVKVLKMIDQEPTADVAPQVEFAREFFEEIDKLVDTYLAGDINTSEFDYLLGELKKKYTEE